jgi:nucleotide-binding universal stress UspA family protein
MESQRVVVVVEDAAAARAALQWAVGNFIRGGDCITLLHVCPPARSRRKRRRLRLGGFQLALAFKDLCNGIAEVRTLDWLARSRRPWPSRRRRRRTDD